MVVLFSSVLFLLLLLLIKEAYKPLHALFTVILFFVLLQFVFRVQLLPLIHTLYNVAELIPYGKELLFSALLLLVGRLIMTLLNEHEYEAIAELVQLAVRLTLLSFWLVQLTPAFKALQRLLERLQ